MKALKNLEVNLKNWGKNNPNISDSSLSCLADVIEKITELEVLSLNLESWGDKNHKITEAGFEKLLLKILDKK